MVDAIKKSLAKTISWRIIATLTTVTIVFIFTGKLKLSLGIGVLEMISKMIFYYGHERIWNSVKYGSK